MNLLFISKISLFSSEISLIPPLIDDMFQVRKINYNQRYFQTLANTTENSVKIGLETISYRASQLWNLFLTEIKDVLSLSKFKEKINS